MSSKPVFIVDDDRAIRESIAELLELEGFPSREASNGKEAFEELKNEKIKPSVILLDLMMPICSGYEFLNLFKGERNLENYPIIIMSAAADGLAVAKNHNVGFLRKPLDADELLSTIEKFYSDAKSQTV